MKVTKELAKKVKDYIFIEKREANIINKQLINNKNMKPYIVYVVGLQKGFKFTYTTEEILQVELRKQNPRFLAYCPIDGILYSLYQSLEYKEMTQETYINQTVAYISNKMVAVPNVDQVIADKTRALKQLLYK